MSDTRRMIDHAPFGTTGHDSSRIIFGAAALGSVSQREADRTLDLLVEHGINHIDTAASYGESEVRLGPGLRRHEGSLFLATKTGERRYGPARDEIRRSLERLGVDRVDLIQLHNLVDAVEWEFGLAPGGALEAAIEAREEGLVRFIGVTGHGLSVAAMHRRSLERFPFDSVLLPYNYVQMQDERYARDFEALAATCVDRGVAVQTIKSVALRPWAGRERTTSTWYEALSHQSDIDKAVHWVMGRSDVFLITPSDVEMALVIDAAERFKGRPADGDMDELVDQREGVPLFV